MHLLIYIDIALFIFIAFFIGYDLFFTLASFFRRRHRKHRSIRLQKFAVIFAAYKEDQVIQESVERILLQDYPADKYRVIVVSTICGRKRTKRSPSSRSSSSRRISSIA